MNILRIGPVEATRAVSSRVPEAAALAEDAAQLWREDRRTRFTGSTRSPEDQRNPDSEPSRLSYSYDEAAGRYVMKLVEAESGEVIRQVPPEELLRVAAAINRYLGLLLDRKH
jgi:flagellar protein FlaG